MTNLESADGRLIVRCWALSPVLAGVTLGMVAFNADFVPDAVGRFLLPVVSSGFAWGVVALVVSYFAPSFRAALVTGVNTLASATVTYYGLVAAVSRRWFHGSSGSGVMGASSLDGLSSLVRASGFWLTAALLGGSVLGCLAYIVRVGSVRNASVAAGTALGLLAGEAAYTLFHVAFIWIGPVDSFVWARIERAATQLLCLAVVVIMALRLRRRSVSMPVLLMTAAVSTVTNIAIWRLIESVRTTL